MHLPRQHIYSIESSLYLPVDQSAERLVVAYALVKVLHKCPIVANELKHVVVAAAKPELTSSAGSAAPLD